MMDYKKHILLTTGLTAAIMCAVIPGVRANPLQGVVTAGQAVISEAGTQLNVTQQSNRVVIDWSKFDIAPNEWTQFSQPSANAIAVNRVMGNNAASLVNGKLTANGNVVIINPNGVLFGNNARVDVNGLIATTADLNVDQFMSGHDAKLVFDKPGNAKAAIVNSGIISAKEAGLVGFVAPNVVNNGIITAKLGKVHLASGDMATVDLYGDNLIQVAVSDGVTSQLVVNRGIIQAEGGQIALTAAAGSKIVNSLIAVQGELLAPAVAEKNGVIYIYAEGSNAVAGNIAADKGKKSGASNVIVQGILDVSGRRQGERGGSVVVTGDHVALLDGTVIDASGSDGLSRTTVNQAKSAYRIGSAGGDIRIGGDYLGSGDTPDAKDLFVGSKVLILNDALKTGDAGRTIFWSDETTQFYGNVYARALGGKAINQSTWNATLGGASGDGGFVETSGHHHLDAGGYVDLTASNGNRGTYFLDPTNITIYGNVDAAFVSSDNNINLAANLKLWIDASDTHTVSLFYSAMGNNATGLSGMNTITVDSNAGLVVGARIRLGSAGSTTTADIMGSDTYTITAINGTTVTLGENLSTNYMNSTIYQGFVNQVTDKANNGGDAAQSAASEMPLWISNGLNGRGILSFDGIDDVLKGSDANLATGLMTIFTTAYNSRSSMPDPSYSSLFTYGMPSFNNFISIGFGSDPFAGMDAYYFSQYGDSAGISNMQQRWLLGSVLYDGNNNWTVSQNGENSITKTMWTNTVLGGEYAIGGIPSQYWAYSPMEGYTADIIQYNTALSTDAQALVNQYQSSKWGISLTPPGTGITEVAQATAADGYSVFTTRYLEHLSQSADISLQALNDISLDLKGDTLNFATAGRSLTLTAGHQINTLSAGSISTNGGNITMNATGGIVLDHTLGLAANGGTIDFANNVQLGANQNWNAGAGAIHFGGTVNGTYNLTANADTMTFAGAIGGNTALNNVSLTSVAGMTLPSVTASKIFAQTTGANSNLVLANGKVLKATGSGNAITLVAKHNLINNAGSGALVTPSGRWLAYSTDAHGTTGEETLASIFTSYGCVYAAPGTCAYNMTLGTTIILPSSGNGLIYSQIAAPSAPAIGVTAPAEKPVPSSVLRAPQIISMNMLLSNPLTSKNGFVVLEPITSVQDNASQENQQMNNTTTLSQDEAVFLSKAQLVRVQVDPVLVERFNLKGDIFSN